MKFQILNRENEFVGDVDISDDVFGVVPRKDIITRVILWQLAKRRSGNHSVKGKSDVHGTTKKMCKQKGTGGARHGSKKAAQFRGGGIVFGPVVRDHSFALPKKVRKLGVKMALSEKVKNGKLIIVDSLRYDEQIKTKEFLEKFEHVGSTLFIDSGNNDIILNALSNVIGYDYIPQIGANVYDIIKKEKIIISLEAIKELESRLA